jgi:hypothetical protein
MANKDAAFGFKPIRTLGGTPYNASMASAYYVPSTYATALFVGDLVVLPATATANAAAVSETMNGTSIGTKQTVAQAAAAAGAEIIGVVVGFEVDRDDLTKQYNPASNERIVYVCDYPDMVYIAQSDGVVAAASAGLNADIVVGSGSTISGKSKMELDSGTTTAPATTNTLSFRLLQAADIPDNDITLANGVWECMINANRHFYRNPLGVA